MWHSSGVVWEMKPKSRWKSFSQKNINLLEKTYQSQLSGKTEGGWVKVDTNLEVRGQRTHTHPLTVFHLCSSNQLRESV